MEGKDEQVGVWAGMVLSLTKAFPEPPDSGWVKSLSRGGAPSSHSKGIVCLEGGKRLSEQGERWDVAEMDTPVLPCQCFSISTGMALGEAHESPLTLALCHEQRRAVRQLSPRDHGAAGVALLVPIAAVWWLKSDEHFGKVKACHSHLYKRSNGLCSLFEAKYHRRGTVDTARSKVCFHGKMSAGD